MKITTRLVIDIESGATLAHEFYEYDGPVDKLCGGDALADQKKQAANSEATLSAQQAGLANKAAGIQMPFLQNRVQNGLPFMNQLTDFNNGTVARSYAPAKAALNRNLAGAGDALPSGAAMQMKTNLNANEAHAFDDTQVGALMANEQAKQQAAAQLNPAQYFSGASGSSGSILSAQPVNSGGFGNFIGGAASGLLNAVASNPATVWTL